jgi:lipoprotein NlpD
MLIRYWLFGLAVLLLSGCTPPHGVYHTVDKGQTLYQIAKTYQVDPDRITRINGISDPTKLSIGDRLFIPGASRVRPVIATVSTTKPASSKRTSYAPPPPTAKQQSSATKPAKPGTVNPAPVRKPAVKAAVMPSAAKKGVFQWPVKGQVIKSFGAKSQSATAHGIEIAIRANSKVLSAAAGKIIYSGNGIPGYGNLIIIQHDDSLYSVYGFNRKNLVESGSFVSQGQEIALSGSPPSGGVPRLYFEARSGKNPVNPIFYLP